MFHGVGAAVCFLILHFALQGLEPRPILALEADLASDAGAAASRPTIPLPAALVPEAAVDMLEGKGAGELEVDLARIIQEACGADSGDDELPDDGRPRRGRANDDPLEIPAEVVEFGDRMVEDCKAENWGALLFHMEETNKCRKLWRHPMHLPLSQALRIDWVQEDNELGRNRTQRCRHGDVDSTPLG